MAATLWLLFYVHHYYILRPGNLSSPYHGYINSIIYVQWEINNILRDVCAWARVYVDDIIYKVKSLPDLFQKLQILFKIFLKYNISIKPTKFYLNYPDIGLLG